MVSLLKSCSFLLKSKVRIGVKEAYQDKKKIISEPFNGFDAFFWHFSIDFFAFALNCCHSSNHKNFPDRSLWLQSVHIC